MTKPHHHRRALLLGEMRESLFMAMNALTSHKLRSALTLLGVLIGVFSIIVVMTAMRVLQSYMETELSMLGANTFWVSKWPIDRKSTRLNSSHANISYA